MKKILTVLIIGTMTAATILGTINGIQAASKQTPPQQERRYTLQLTAFELQNVLKGLGKLSIEEGQSTHNTVLGQAIRQEQQWEAQAKAQQQKDSVDKKKKQ